MNWKWHWGRLPAVLILLFLPALIRVLFGQDFAYIYLCLAYGLSVSHYVKLGEVDRGTTYRNS